MWEWIIGGIATALGLLLVGVFWDDIRDQVASWLRHQGLAHSDLMNAWIRLDDIVGSIRCKIFVKTRQRGQEVISEKTYTMDEITDADVRAELERRGYSERNILDQIH
ncbi:MAG: hypothetical protein ETSY1_34410 [Candidatus Entotheonella factor]|uniref:Uncharacterized protein n=1 Tax=Entotheonella factor TaxID=1429438 RepID=W4LB44_ENTF1|nr:MAG: hypothetical protein ETSY1_34410 [Candidatus Entotheonella factor]